MSSHDTLNPTGGVAMGHPMESINPDEHSDVVWGSPQYFAPEQAAGSAPSPSSDVYSLGILLYELAVGRLPFPANSLQDAFQFHTRQKPPSPRSQRPSSATQAFVR